MKKNKLIGLLLLTLHNFCHANLVGVNAGASGDPNLQKYAMENKLPMPDSGIQIAPETEMPNMNSRPVPANFKIRSLEEERAEEKKLGYINLPSEDAIQLLGVKKNRFYLSTKKIFIADNNPTDTHLKATLTQIKLAFPFNGITFIDKNNIIGYAVAGTWQDGWAGVSEVFQDSGIGICSYVKHNLKITHGAAKLAREYVTYDVNSKSTIIFAEGQKDQGFAYKVEWFDDTFFHTLKCASEKFSQEAKESTILLAKRIDLDPQ